MNQPGYARGPLCAVVTLLLWAAPGTAQEPTAPREHVVRSGDTLWDLAGSYLGNPFLWPMIYEGNRSVVENPHWIYPGELLRIPGSTPMPGAEPLGEPVAAAPVQPVQSAQPVQPVQPGAGEAAQVAAATGGIATLDLRRVAITEAEYLATPWLDAGIEGQVMGRVLRLANEPRTAEDQIEPMLHPHYQVFIGALGSQASAVGDSLLIVRLGREVRGYGQIVEPLALVRVDSVTGAVLAGTLLVQFAEARVGDRLVRLAPRPELPRGRAEAVSDGAGGRLLEFLEEQLLYGTGDKGFVVMDSEPLRPGDELTVYAAGASAAALPVTEVARARVIRVAGGVATVRLTGVFDTSVGAGLPVRLVARMP